MGKYLKRFGSEYEYAQYEQSGEFIKPNVSVIGYIQSGSGAQGNLTIDGIHYTADYGSSYGG